MLTDLAEGKIEHSLIIFDSTPHLCPLRTWNYEFAITSPLIPLPSRCGSGGGDYFVGRFPGVGSHPPSSDFGATGQRRAD